MGFNYIQISPVTPTKNETKNIWWMLYQPTDFVIGNYLGDKKDLINLCEEAKKYNIKIIVDVVLRHLASDDYNSLLPHHKDNSYINSRNE